MFSPRLHVHYSISCLSDIIDCLNALYMSSTLSVKIGKAFNSITILHRAGVLVFFSPQLVKVCNSLTKVSKSPFEASIYAGYGCVEKIRSVCCSR